MKKNDSLQVMNLKPKSQTIQFLMAFSKSVEILGTRRKSYVISKN